MIISGWGSNIKQEAEVFFPNSEVNCNEILSENTLIPRGMGRSYGDSANHANVLQTSYFNHFTKFDKEKGIIKCQAGITIRELLNLILPSKWFIPVSPGTSLVTLGGALASDVHGKNHHNSGSFSNFVIQFDIMLGNGEIISVSKKKYPDLFYATCGGMGLTGIVLNITLRLKKIFSSLINQTTIKALNLEALCEKFDIYSQHSYSVAWLDCLNLNKRNLKSIFIYGDHSNVGEIKDLKFNNISVPNFFPSFVLNNISMKLFNKLYFTKFKKKETLEVPLKSFFYPLDNINNWNRIYGKNGFVQYQFVIPKKNGVKNLKKIINVIIEFDIGSYLAVLKLFGKKNKNYLSFPIEGYSLALDFKKSKKLIFMINKLDSMIIEFGGKIYLTKDSLMNEKTFKYCYEDWEIFQEVRNKYNALGKFRSSQSTRLGLE